MKSQVHLWMPRGDEHQLAASLGMVQADANAQRDLTEQTKLQIESEHGVDVIIHRWHVWRIVRAMQRVGVQNTPDGRAAAFMWLATHAGEK